MNKREELEFALIMAEAVLVDRALNPAEFRADGDDVDAIIEKARADCRRARTALAEINRVETAIISDRSLNILIGDLHAIGRRGASSHTLSKQLASLGVSDDIGEKQGDSERQLSLFEVEINTAEQEASGETANKRARVIRQSVGLFSLVLAYLQYYFLNVYFQIAILPVAYTLWTH